MQFMAQLLGQLGVFRTTAAGDAHGGGAAAVTPAAAQAAKRQRVEAPAADDGGDEYDPMGCVTPCRVCIAPKTLLFFL